MVRSEADSFARPYAQAAFELARDESSLGAWGDFLAALGELVQHDSFVDWSVSPLARRDEVAKAVEEILSPILSLSPTQHAFIKVLCDASRLQVAQALSEAYQSLTDEHLGVCRAYVETAYSLTQEQTQELSALLKTKYTKSKKIVLEERVLPTVLGGVRLRVKDQVIDFSMAGRLSDFAAAIKRD